jgi:folate-binding protein YgfZ
MAREFARIRGQGPFKTCGKTMLKQLTDAHRATRLADWGVVRVQGADAVKFLQGQVSNDVSRLVAGSSLLAGLHNPQGRAIALLRLVLADSDTILALLPRELAAGVAARLAKFVLRAKVKVTDASSEWAVFGVELVDGERRGTDVPGTWALVSDTPARWLATVPIDASGAAEDSPASREHWRALDIAAGTPQVYAATSEAFVAQMLNLDIAGGISFEKGCYTGQEVIARAHYRGKVKRRMQRFVTVEAARLAIGDVGTLKDGRGFRVVEAVEMSDGRCEFLAVAPTNAGSEDASSAADTAGATSSAPALAGLAVQQLALPYELPA